MSLNFRNLSIPSKSFSRIITTNVESYESNYNTMETGRGSYLDEKIVRDLDMYIDSQKHSIYQDYRRNENMVLIIVNHKINEAKIIKDVIGKPESSEKTQDEILLLL